jgi:protein TonB
VFDHLIESRKQTDFGALARNSAVSAVIHAVFISGAVYATLNAGNTNNEHVRAVAVTVQTQKKEEQKKEEPPPEKRVATVNPPPKGFQTLSIPTNIPVDIPPPQQNQHFDAADFSGVGVEGGVARGVEGGTGPVVSDQPYMEAVVEERPEQIAGTCILPRYPEILRQAGIEGRVMIEFIIDTLGRAERPSMRVINSFHNLAEAPAKETVQSCRFRPGRIQGRAVRVRVQIPINFSISR